MLLQVSVRLWVAFGSVAISLPCAAQSRVPARDDSRKYDEIVERFIQYDIGNVEDPFEIPQIIARFQQLPAEAVPSLVRGLNWATQARASCPITAISEKLQNLLRTSNNPEVGAYVLRHLEKRNVGRYQGHLVGVFRSAEQQIVREKGKEYAEQHFKRKAAEDQQRMAFTPGMRLTDLPPRDPSGAATTEVDALSTLSSIKSKSASSSTELRDQISIAELAEALSDKKSQAKALEELHQRANTKPNDVAEHSEAIAAVLQQGDVSSRESAARLLGLVRSEASVPALIAALEDKHPRVRSAAATALTRITRQLFGPDENATPAEARDAIRRWQDWWKKQQQQTSSSRNSPS